MAMQWGWLMVAAALTSACASTGAVPRPFPGARLPQGTPSSEISPGPESAPAPVVDAYALVGTALALRGTPYRNGGSDPSGFDCSGFTQYVFGRYGVGLPREVREQFRQGRPIDTSELSPGDLIFFATTDPNGASHVAILVGGDEFVHAPSSTGVVRVEHLRASYWSQRFIGARRVSPQTTTQN